MQTGWDWVTAVVVVGNIAAAAFALAVARRTSTYRGVWYYGNWVGCLVNVVLAAWGVVRILR